MAGNQSNGAPYRRGQNCNPFGRTKYGGNDAPQAVDAQNGTFGTLAACQIFKATGPELAHLVLEQAINFVSSGQTVLGWGTSVGGNELPICRSTPWYDPATGRFRVQTEGAITVAVTVHTTSDTSSGYRRLSMLWLPAAASLPTQIAVCEKPPASDTAVPVPLQIQISPNLGSGDTFWFVVEYEPSDVQVVALAFPFSWISLTPA